MHVVCPSCDGINRLPADKNPLEGRCGRCREKLFLGQPVNLNAQRWQVHLQRSDIPLLVDFWAPWCGPCRSMAPVFEEAARELEPQLRLIKVNTEVEQALAAGYAIRSIPTLALFRDGREVARLAGALDRASLFSWVRSNV